MVNIRTLLSKCHTVPDTRENITAVTLIRKVWPYLCRFSHNSQMFNNIVLDILSERHPNRTINVESRDRNSLRHYRKYGFHRADFHETQHHSIHFFEHSTTSFIQF
jgi:hypothetical protein